METQELVVETWECVDNHGHYFTTNSLTAIGWHVVAFWPLETNTTQNKDSKGETNDGHEESRTN